MGAVRPVIAFWRLRPRPGDTPVERLRALVNRGLWEQYANLPRRKIRHILKAIFWPVIAVAHSFAGVVRYGKRAQSNCGPPLATQLAQQYGIAVKDRLNPRHFYQFGLYRSDRFANARRFLPNMATRSLIKAANGRLSEWDKIDFAADCARLGLPHVKPLATFRNGRISPELAPDDLPRDALFLKPATLWKGLGGERWRHGLDGYVRDEEEPSTAEQFLERARRLSLKTPYVLQPVIRNHPDLLRINNGSLSTIRLTTGFEMGAPSPVLILAAFRMGTGRAVVDNFTSGGIAAGVDNRSGILGPAIGKDPIRPPYDVHPDTQQRITGTVLPFWNETVALCLQAHRCFPDLAIVGWDVALTPEGPLLVEANLTCCVEILQTTHGIAILDTPFTQVILSRIEHS